MSWKSSIMVQRSEFVRLASVEGQEFSEACSRFGISRKTGYKWMNRFREEGESGLADRSRRPKKSPDKSSKKTESMVVKLREKHPRWGGRKLRQRLLDLDRRNVPSARAQSHRFLVDMGCCRRMMGRVNGVRFSDLSGSRRTNYGRWISRDTLRWWVAAGATL